MGKRKISYQNKSKKMPAATRESGVRRSANNAFIRKIINEFIDNACSSSLSNTCSNESTKETLAINHHTENPIKSSEGYLDIVTILLPKNDICCKFVSDNKCEQTSIPANSELSSSVSKMNEPDKYTPLSIDSRRIIDFTYFMKQLLVLNEHSPAFGCSLRNFVIYKEHKIGLKSTLFLHCNMCNTDFRLETCEGDINSSAVEGLVSCGTGFSNGDELFTTLNIPFMSKGFYNKCHDKVSVAFESLAVAEMKEAAIEEAEYAKSVGSIDSDGMPLITVVADGCWAKRSYRSNYNSLSGAAAIVGHQFGKVLYLAVKNKYCSICATNKTIKHICYKNYSGSSSGMESESLLEGFKASESMYGLRYSTVIADGDSSTYKKLIEGRPYKNLTVEKIECRNHLLRNYCNKLKNISTDTRFPMALRKILNSNILRLRTAIVSAIKYRTMSTTNLSETITLLKKDIDNSFHHVIGEHSMCDSYFCTGSKNIDSEKNVVESFKNCREMYIRICTTVSAISNHSRSLIKNKDSNIVESFNSIIAKFVGGKRINFCRRRSYATRCYGAVISHNTKKLHTKMYQTLHGPNVPTIISKYARKKIYTSQYQEMYNKNKINRNRQFKHKNNPDYYHDKDYGSNATQTDIDNDMLKIEKELFLKRLERTPDEKKNLERDTVLQAESGFWLEERRKLLTASNFFRICRRKSTTLSGPLVKQLLYSTTSLNVPSLMHGKNFEKIAILQLERQENIFILSNGLFIDDTFCFLGATPDGVVDDNLIVEIKCPISIFNKNIEDSIIEGKLKFWKYNKMRKTCEINTNHQWYYQIQGQLRVTNKSGCLLGVWAASGQKIKTEYVCRRKDFWEKKMEKPLSEFYMNCILPELIDPRHTRNLPIREPNYILEAIKKREKKTVQIVDLG